MTQKEYNQKKQECWEEFNNDVGRCKDRPKICFFRAFDRAYALGEQTESITQEEIEKAAEKYADEIKIPVSFPGVMVPFIKGLAHDSYLQGAQDFLGKQKKDADAVIQGWAARDEDGAISAFQRKPTRQTCFTCGFWDDGSGCPVDLTSKDLFPDLTWDSEPEEVEIILKRKKK